MSDPFLAEIRIWGCNYAPRGWAFCDGQILPISQNTALFSLVGTSFGGNGTTTFGLPNFRDSVPVATGAGPGLTPRDWGEQGGEEAVTLQMNQTPRHGHQARVQSARADLKTPDPTYVLGTSTDGSAYASGNAPNTAMAANTLNNVAGSSQPHNNIQPFLTLNFTIATVGIYPQRS